MPLVLLVFCGTSPGAAANEAAPQSSSCTLEPGATHTVACILDGDTVLLDDGSEVRLIGALAPHAADAGAARDAWPPEAYAIRTLTELVLGRPVKLTYGGLRTDRYGRHLAHLFLIQGGSETWVQGQLLAAGAARAYGLPGSFECGHELIAHER